MKNNIQFKIFILSILIIIPIGILYFNLGEDLFIDVKENLNNRIDGNYINICNPTKGQFYNLSPSSLQPMQSAKSLNTDISSCKYECDKNDCDLYLITQNNDCNIYNLKSGFEKIKVNCNHKPLPPDEYTYLGEGRVDKKFYNSNKDKFDHIDYLFDKALDEDNGIIKDYMDINNKLNDLKLGDDTNRLPLYNMYDNVNLKLKKLADYLDLNRNSLYSNFVHKPGLNDYSMLEDSKINLGNKELSYIEMLNEYNRFYDESKDLEGRMDNDNLEYNRKYLVYTILTILMIITVIIFIVYRSLPDLFNDSFLIFYFIGVLLLVFFIHTYFKV
tara:strand:+ start:2771 stop:3760 length:990 start_codon:yes stop_codon:yes gene_type:complete